MGIVAAYAVPHPPLAMPEVGRGQERAIQDTLDAYREVARRIAAHAPETIVVVSPHAPLFRDCFHLSTGDFDRGDMGRFGAWDSSMTVQYDGEMTAAIAACARKHTVPLCGSGMGGKDLDHATIVPLHFVNEAYSTYQVVRIGLSGLSPQTHLALGRCIAEAAADLDRSCVLIASGDLSHKLASDGPYGYAPQGPVFDRMVTALFDAGDLSGLLEIDETFGEEAAECGLRSFWIMAGALEGLPISHELLSYEGPFGVGYAVAAFEVQGSAGDGAVRTAVDRDEDRSGARDAAANDAPVDPYVALARASVEGFVRTGNPIAVPDGLPPELSDKRAGVFVSLHEHGAEPRRRGLGAAAGGHREAKGRHRPVRRRRGAGALRGGAPRTRGRAAPWLTGAPCAACARTPARFPKDGAGCAGRALPTVDGSSTRITGA